MNRFLIIVAAVALLLVGCKNPEKAFVGTWSAQGASAGGNVELKEDKSWSMGNMMAGTWAMDGDKKAKLTVTTLQGKPVKEAIDEGMKKAQAMGMSKNVLDQQRKMAEEQLNSLVLTLSEDGKTATMPNAMTKQPVTLTKQESK